MTLREGAEFIAARLRHYLATGLEPANIVEVIHEAMLDAGKANAAAAGNFVKINNGHGLVGGTCGHLIGMGPQRAASYKIGDPFDCPVCRRGPHTAAPGMS